MATELPTVTHLVCEVEAAGIVTGMIPRTNQLLEGWLAALGCECVEYPGALLVGAWMNQALDEWFSQQVWPPGYPVNHTANYCQPAPVVDD